MAKRAGSNSIQDLELADSLESKDQFLFFQNSTKKTKRVTRSAMFASAGVSVELLPAVSGLDNLLEYNLTGDPVFQQYSGFLDQRNQFLQQASGFLDQRRQLLDQATGLLSIATGLLNDTGAQIRQDLVDLETSFTGASGVLRSSIDLNYIVATGVSGTLAAKIETLNSEFTGATGSLGSTINNFSLTFANATGTLAQKIEKLNSDFTGASGVLRSTIEDNYLTVTTATGTLAQRINTLNSEFTGASGALRATIVDNASTFVNASGALAERINTLNTEFTGASGALRATISGNELAFVNASGALAQRISTLNSDFTGASGALRATITDNYSTFTNASGALAERITNLDARFTGASGVLRATINDNYSAFTNASGALAARIETTSAYASGISGSVVQETSARINSVSGVSGAIALNWGIKLNGDSGVIGAIKMVGDGETSAFLVMTDKFKVQTPSKVTPAGADSSQVTLVDMTTNGIVFGADVMSNNYSAGAAGWRIRRTSGDAEFNNVTVRGQIKGGTTLGDSTDSEFGLVVNSQFGIRRSVNNGTLTLTGGSGNGILNGAQIDMVGSDFGGAGGGAQGQMIISAGYKSNMSDTYDGAIVFRTARESADENKGAIRLIIEKDGTVSIVSANNVYSGAPNGGAGKLVVDTSVEAPIYTSTSSKRFKKKIRNLKNGLETVSKLRPVVFDWKTKDLKNDIGLIAEEVNEIVPTIVGLDKEGEVVGVDYGKLTPILIQAVKELALEVERLKNKIK